MNDKLIILDNLFSAWYEFKRGKHGKQDVMFFERNLEDNIFQLYDELITKKYVHQPYHTFYIYDPKFRIINKAAVRDRIVHHLLFKFLERVYQPIFIYHSYSCQKEKGVHLSVENLNKALRKASANYRQPLWALKMDIKKFFASVDHDVLFELLKKKIIDPDALWLSELVIRSYNSGTAGKGMPIGNLTSQIFANVYLSQLDYFAKFNLKTKYYFRYADDFIVLHQDKNYLLKILDEMKRFVVEQLTLTIHPNKIILRKFNQGIDWLGYVLMPYYRVMRTKTKKRMFAKVKRKIDEFNNRLISEQSLHQTIQSYTGVLKYCAGHDVEQRLMNEAWLLVDKPLNSY